MIAKYYDAKWQKVIKLLPKGGDYRFDMRQASYSVIKNIIPDGSKVFDYACGLGIIDIQLERDKNCKCYGCDYSGVAVEYVNMNITRGEFKHTDKIFGKDYDFILGIAYLEHTTTPREWIDEMLERTKCLILTIPNNYRQQGEHSDMQWSNWAEFTALLEGLDYDVIRDYPGTEKAWCSPIIIIKKEGVVHPDYINSSTGEDKPKEVKAVKKAKKSVIEKPKKVNKKTNKYVQDLEGESINNNRY